MHTKSGRPLQQGRTTSHPQIGHELDQQGPYGAAFMDAQSSHRWEAGERRQSSCYAYTMHKTTLSQTSTVAILGPNWVDSSETKGQSSSDPTSYATSTTHSKNQPKSNAPHQKT
jgi:hypothetical protein